MIPVKVNTSWLLLVLTLVVGMSCKKTSQTNETAIETSNSEEPITTADTKTVMFYGTSITAGYQLDMSEAFAALIQDRFDSLGMKYTTINAGLSGETTASGLSRVDWVLKTPIDVFVLELGANDGLRGISTIETDKNLQSIIDKVIDTYPDCKILLAGMMIPPNMGQDYTAEFQKIFPKVAERNNLPIIPFLLEGVAGEPELNLEDGIHPTAEGHKILTDNIWPYLLPLLEE